MTQTIGCWNARLWIHFMNGKTISGNVPTFSGYLEISEDRIYPDGQFIIGGVVIKTKDSTIVIPSAREAIALSCEGKALRDIVEIPPCGNPDIDRAADEAFITSASLKEDALTLTYENRRTAWEDIQKDSST